LSKILQPRGPPVNHRSAPAPASVRCRDSERFLKEVRDDDRRASEATSIEERELEAGSQN